MRFVWKRRSGFQQISQAVDHPAHGAACHRGGAPVAKQGPAQERPLGQAQPHQPYPGQDAQGEEDAHRDGAGAAQHQLQQQHGDEVEIDEKGLVPDGDIYGQMPEGGHKDDRIHRRRPPEHPGQGAVGAGIPGFHNDAPFPWYL